MKHNTSNNLKIWIRCLLIVFFLLINIYELNAQENIDTEPPVITIVNAPLSLVQGDQASVYVTVTDNYDISYVTFSINDIEYIMYATGNPNEYVITIDAAELGLDTITYDYVITAMDSSSNEVIEYYSFSVEGITTEIFFTSLLDWLTFWN